MDKLRYFLCLFICSAILVLITNGSAYTQTAKAGRLRAGAAKVDITPKESELATPTDSIRDHLFTRAIVIDNGITCAVIVGSDMAMIPDQVQTDAISRLIKSTGCPEGNYIMAGSHTHSGATGAGPGEGAPTAQTVVESIVSAVNTAKSRLAPARMGYGTAQIDLNVNRDLFTSDQHWRQRANPDGPSDKTLSVLEFIGEDDVPIAVFYNYAMHPINFYLSGVISADFPGEASRCIEELFDNRTVAVFSQGACGDQNPRLGYTASYNTMYAYYAEGTHPPVQTVGPPPPLPVISKRQGFNPARAGSSRKAIPPENLDAYKKAIARTGDYVFMLGQMIGTTAVRVMRNTIQTMDTARIWSGQETVSCPGRDRLDTANPVREDALPPYKDGAPVNVRVNLLRIGDVNLLTVNGAVYSAIALRLKAAVPATKTMVIAHASRDYVGYIPSDDAYYHLTFQVIGTRLKPGCAEKNIISMAVDLMHQSGQ